MSDQTKGSQLVAYTVEKNPSFLKDTLQLKKLLKSLDKASKVAVDTLLQIIATTEDERLKSTCCTTLLTFYLDAAKADNADKMQRKIAEIRLNRPNNLIPINGEEPKKKPVVDFNIIQKIE